LSLKNNIIFPIIGKPELKNKEKRISGFNNNRAFFGYLKYPSFVKLNGGWMGGGRRGISEVK